MGLKKHGVVVGCEHCRYQTKGGVGGFIRDRRAAV